MSYTNGKVKFLNKIKKVGKVKFTKLKLKKKKKKLEKTQRKCRCKAQIFHSPLLNQKTERKSTYIYIYIYMKNWVIWVGDEREIEVDEIKWEWKFCLCSLTPIPEMNAIAQWIVITELWNRITS